MLLILLLQVQLIKLLVYFKIIISIFLIKKFKIFLADIGITIIMLDIFFTNI